MLASIRKYKKAVGKEEADVETNKDPYMKTYINAVALQVAEAYFLLIRL